MDDKNLFDRQNGQGIRGRINKDQRSTVLLDEPMISEEYRDYQYSEPVEKKIITDNDELESKEDSGSSSLATARNTGIKDPAIEFGNELGKQVGKGPLSLSEQTKVRNSINEAKGIRGTYDEMFSFLNGIADTRISSKQGDLLRNNIGLQEKLDYITNTVNKAKEAKMYEQELHKYEDDPAQFNKVHNMYENAMREYLSMKPKSDEYLQGFHDESKDENDVSEISKLKGSDEVLNYLNKRIEANQKETEEKLEDINEEQAAKRYLNSVYSITPEYQEKAANTKFAFSDPSTWKYTVPSTLGSSFSLIEATAIGTAASLAGNFALKQLPKLAMSGGASMLAGLAISVGASSVNVWANIAARQQESNAEVFDSYKQKLYNEAEKGNFDVNDAIKKGSEKLKNEVGLDITGMTQDQILSGMISFNVNIDTPGFNEVKTSARKDLDKLYDQNMALVISDIGQSLLVVPGVGKLFKKAVTLNGRAKLGEDLAKYTDKFVNNTTRRITENMSKLKTIPVTGRQFSNVTQTGIKRLVNKGLSPLAKIGVNALLEGNEEGIQYIDTKNYINDKFKDQPTNLLKGLIQDVDASIDAFSGLLGVSSDPALNNDVELAQSMKLGAVIGIVIGGGSEVLMPGSSNPVGQYVDEVSGSNVAKNLTANHIKAKEDMETIKQYAVEGFSSESKRKGYLDQLEEMKSTLPPGLDSEDIDIEIQRAKKVFSYLDSPLMNTFASKLGIEKGTDEYNTLLALSVRSNEASSEAQKQYTASKKKYDNLWATPEVEEFFEQHDIPVESRNDYLQYIKLNTEQRALSAMIDEVTVLGDSFNELGNKYGVSVNKDRFRSYQYELANNHTKLKSAIERQAKLIEEEHKFAPEFDRIDDVEYATTTSLPSVLLNAVRVKEATDISDAFRNVYKGNKSRTSESIVKKALAEYNNAQEINEQANELAMQNDITPDPIVTSVEDNDKHIEDTAKDAIKPSNQAGVTLTPDIDDDVVKSISKPSEEIISDPSQVTAEEEKVAEKPLKQATVASNKPSKLSAEELMRSMMEGSNQEDGVELEQPDNNKKEELPDVGKDHNDVDKSGSEEETSKSIEPTEPVKKESLSSSELMDLMDSGNYLNEIDTIIPDGVAEEVDHTLEFSEDKIATDKLLTDTDDKATDESTLVGTSVEDGSVKDFGFTSGTVYFTGKAMFPGYEDAEAFDTFLSQPDALTDADIRIVVGEPGAKYNDKFKPSDKATWDEAAIYVTVEKNGKKYAGALKTISGAIQQYAKTGKDVDIKDVNKLKEIRTEILEAYLIGGKDAIIRPDIVARTNGLFNVNRDKEGKPINRPITQIKGFNIPEDLKDLEEDGLVFGVGRGLRNNFYIADKTGHALDGIGGSGKIYLYPRKKDTPSGVWSPPIKLNELRFKDAPDLTELLYNTFVANWNGRNQYEMNVAGKQIWADFSYMDITNMLINEGEHTLVFEGNKKDFGYLTSKQFYFDRKVDIYHIGDNLWRRSFLLTKQGKAEFIKYVNENLHVNTDENTMFEKLPHTLYSTMYKNKLDSISLSKSFSFTKEDVDLNSFVEGPFGVEEKDLNPLTSLGWMVKNGWLKSDLSDQLFKSPFLYVRGVKLEIPKIEQQKPVEQVKEHTDTNTAPGKGDGTGTFMDDPDFRDWFGLDLELPISVVTKEAKAEHTERAKKWLMKKLGLTEDQILVGDAYVRAAANGTMVMGTTYRDCIALADATVAGTGYHEAFHRVSTLLMSKAQQRALYSEHRRINPDKKDYTNLQIEEALAEDFRAMMLRRDKPLYSILKWFNPIATFIRKIFKPHSISTIYNMIADGDFSKYKMDADRYAEFENAYPEGLTFTIGEGTNTFSPKAFPDLTSYYQTIKTLSAALLYKNGVRTLDDVSKINTSVLRGYLGTALNKSSNPNTRIAIRELLDHFDTVIMPDIMEELSRMAIKTVDRDANKEMEDKDAVNMQIIQNYDKASYEVSKKDNALASAKMFIGTIVKVNFVYNEIDGVKVRSAVPQMNALLGLPDFVDFDTSWNLMLNNLYDSETYTDMVEKTRLKSKESPFFYQLHKSLSKVTDTNLQTQLLQTVKSNKHNMMTVSYGTRSSGVGNALQIYWGVNDSSADRAIKAYPATWSQVFYNSDLVIQSNEGTTVNKEAIYKIRDEYKSIYEEVRNANAIMTDAKIDFIIKDVVKLLNRIGIAIDAETINSLLTDPKVTNNSDTRATTLYKFITDIRNGSLSYVFTDNLPSVVDGPKEHKTSKGSNVRTVSNIYEGLGKNSIISLLAKHYAQLNPNPEEMSVLGANNNLLYPISQNCYMSDQVRWLNLDPNTLKQLNQVTYCGNSLIKEAISSKHTIKLNTFVNFKNEDGGDSGRDYMEISPIEDYLSKMTLTANNHILLPTMADKKMYFTISGVRLFNDPLVIVQDGSSQKLSFSDSTINQFVKVGLDEINTIIKYYNNKKLVDADKDLNVKNYHSSNFGGRFRHFTHIAKTVNGVTELISLNDILDKAEKNGTIPATLESLRTKLFSSSSDSKYVHDTINDMLKYLMAAEVASCEKLGIISRKDGVISNKLLDQARFNDITAVYKDNIATAKYAEHYAALSMIGNYAVNSSLSIIEFEKVFSGDPAFYKNTDDKIKRLSEVLSTGDNLRIDWEPGHRLANRQQFTAVELKDNEIASHQFDELKDLFTISYTRKYIRDFYGIGESNLDSAVSSTDSKKLYPDAWKEAEKSATAAVSAYGFDIKKNKGNINQADAAVYIRPEMYRDIMEMLGEWSPEIAKAYDIMESDTDWLNNPKLYHESLEALIKPLKMMYYGQHLIPELGIQVPIFDKMAMFPMFRVLATGDNRDMYERMNGLGKYSGNKPIDMVAFGSAVKVGSRSPGDFYTDAHNTEISDLNKWSVFKQDFKYLRRQLVTDPHHAERQMLGTQAAKGALSNLVLNRVYGEGKDGEKLTGAQIKFTVFESMNQLSNLGIERVKSEITNEAGVIDEKKLSDFLIRSAKSKNMGSEILDGLKIVDGKFNMPLSAIADSKWIESEFIGLTNKEAIDINTPGGAFIQMSSFGYKSINKTTDRAYNNGNRLNLRNPDGSMDAVISINLFSHMIPGYNNKSYIQARQWLIDNDIIGTHKAVNPIAMGYRIPTQGLSSISALRVVDIFPSNIGDTVMLPDEFTALTGSD